MITQQPTDYFLGPKGLLPSEQVYFTRFAELERMIGQGSDFHPDRSSLGATLSSAGSALVSTARKLVQAAGATTTTRTAVVRIVGPSIRD